MKPVQYAAVAVHVLYAGVLIATAIWLFVSFGLEPLDEPWPVSPLMVFAIVAAVPTVLGLGVLAGARLWIRHSERILAVICDLAIGTALLVMALSDVPVGRMYPGAVALGAFGAPVCTRDRARASSREG
jgi:hypothetical protein